MIYYSTYYIIFFYELTPQHKINQKKQNIKHSEQNIKVEITQKVAKFGS